MKLLAFFAAMLASSPTAAPNTLDYPALQIGARASALIAAQGPPEVVTTDIGHIWTWKDAQDDTVRVTTDDDGIVRMVDLVPNERLDLRLTIPTSPPRRVDFNRTTSYQMDALLAAPTSTATSAFPDNAESASLHAYDLGADLDVVALFTIESQRLRELFYGMRAALERAGLVAVRSAQPHYTAPQLLRKGSADYPPTNKQGDAYLRIVVDPRGSVKGVTVYSSSGDAQLDTAATVEARSNTFTPATLDGVPTSGVYFEHEVFREIHAH